MPEKPVPAILFVCLGNICRSPLAEGVFRTVAQERFLDSGMTIDSAGTGGWHAGSPPDPRSVAIARSYGIDISGQKARRISRQDFENFDLILGMDLSNVADLRAAAPTPRADRIHLFHEFATGRALEVPDPYCGGADGFDGVYRMIRDAAESLADRLADPR